jgi:hypothetical protein
VWDIDDMKNTKIMKPEKIRVNELAPCGVYCGACPAQLAKKVSI